MSPTEDKDAQAGSIKAVVVGSGFAGAVTACRLAQAGVEVHVLERGRRYEDLDFPSIPQDSRREKGTASSTDDEYEPPRDFARWFWAIDQGLWDVRDLGSITAVQAAGYGGGSLIYANVHLRAPPDVFEARDENDHSLWPQCYRRTGALDGYYNLAAYMLDAKPFPIEKHHLAKHARLKEAGDKNWFAPPLAINFADAGINRWGVHQGSCDLRGFCTLGCQARAKNTLDFNYLAIAEDPTRSWRGAKSVNVLTLAEVEGIEIRSDESGKRFRLTYHDHLLKDDGEIDADYVFLCAGAVNTTELLFANQDHLFAREPERKQQLGERYFANGDSIAVVFDAQRPHEVDRGPTITGSLVYDIDGNWFLVQDGGVPEGLDAALGVFRSPLWLRRNRFREERVPSEVLGFVDTGRLLGRALPATPVQVRAYRQLKPRGARELFAMLPPHSAESVSGSFGPKLPLWLKVAFKKDREELLTRLSRLTEPAANEILEQLAQLLDQRLMELSKNVGSFDLLENAKDLGIARGLLRLGAQLLWGSESDAIRQTLNFVDRRIPKNLDDMARRALLALRWAAAYAPGDGRTGVLLTMGRDPKPGRLDYHFPSDQPLTATFKNQDHRTLQVTQERALRDIAEKWGGELRTNPAWTFAKRRVTVHGQGGCHMAEDQDLGVTDPDGEVRGCEGLFVMDAAAFPSAVGVNPSATIAAVAELKIEHFIRTHLPTMKNWRAPEYVSAQLWACKQKDQLAPLQTSQVRPSTQPQAELIGLEFSEVMRGHFSTLPPLPPDLATPVANFETFLAHTIKRRRGRDKVLAWIHAREECELNGVRRKVDSIEPGVPLTGSLDLNVDAKIADLTKFLEDQHQQTQEPLDLSATLRFTNGKPVSASGKLELFRPGTEMRTRMKLLKYKLKFDHDGDQYCLLGLKIIEDDPRLDVWHDTATLYFGIYDGKGKEIRSGILRVPVESFLEDQIKSFKVTGTTDPARQVWALTAFLALFSRELLATYLPELKSVPDLVRNMLTRTHG